MKSKLTKRILAVVITAVALSVLLAVSSLAAITGGYGNIVGLEDGKNYEAAEVTLNSTGDGIATGTPFALNDTSNKGLAGLYKVREEGTTTWSDVIYVYGKVADRKALYSRNGAGYFNLSSTSFIPEYFYGGYVGKGGTAWIADSAFGKNGICSIGVQLPETNYKPFYNAVSSSVVKPAKKQEAFETLAAYLAQSYMHYTFASNEIIPITDIETYKYTVRRQQGVFSYKGQVSEFEVLVILPSGELKSYIYSHVAADLGPEVTKVVDFTKATSEHGTWKDGLPTEGYVVAFKYHLYANLEDYTKATAPSCTYGQRWMFTFDAANYVIKSPSVEAPQGITVEGRTFKNLDPDATYSIAPYTILGADETQKKTITGVTDYDLTQAYANPAGVYGIAAAGGDYYGDSSAVFVFVEGKWTEREALGSIDTSKNELYSSVSKDTEWKVGHFLGASGVVNNVHYKNIKSPVGPIFSDDWSYTPSLDGMKSDNPGEVRAAKEAFIKDVLQKKVLRYAYEPNDILPVTELKTLTLGCSKFVGCTNSLIVNSAIPKVEFYVMDKTGAVNVYTWTGDTKVPNSVGVFNNTNIIKVDVQSTPNLPSEGWIVGFKYHPYAIVDPDDMDPTNFKGGNLNTMFLVGQGEANYEIAVNQYPRPDGITIDGYLVSGLDPAMKYAIAPCDLSGVNMDNAVTLEGADIADGTYTIDPDQLSGLLGLVVMGDDYFKESDPVLIYLYGPYENRKDIGEKYQAGDIDAISGDPVSDSLIGKVKVGSGYNAFLPGHLTHNATFYAAHDLMGESHFSNAFIKKLYEAEEADKQAVVDEYAPTFTNYIFRYALTSPEILPVADIYDFKISNSGSVVATDFTFTTKNSIFRFIVHVMNQDGTVTKHIADIPYVEQKFNANAPQSFNINFADDTMWDTPIAQDGYFLAYEYYPFWGLTKPENFEIKYNGDQDTIPSEYAYRARGQAFLPKWTIKENAPAPVLATFPVVLPDGHGEISGLDAKYLYEVRILDEATGKWSQWIDVPARSTAYHVTLPGTYGVRVKETEQYVYSDIVEVVVTTYTSEYPPFDSEIITMHLPSDFVELTAEYEMDVTVKNWVSTLALANIKTVSPSSVITISGDGYKFVVKADKIDLEGNKAHYLDMTVAFDGESRFDKDYEGLKALAGEKYVKEVHIESSTALPFEEAEFMIFVGDDQSGNDVQLRSYNRRINKLRNVETSTVIDGWVTFTNYATTYVIITKN